MYVFVSRTDEAIWSVFPLTTVVVIENSLKFKENIFYFSNGRDFVYTNT